MSPNGVSPVGEESSEVRYRATDDAGSDGRPDGDDDARTGTRERETRYPQFVDETGKVVLVQRYRPAYLDRLVDFYDAIQSTALGLPPATRSSIQEWLDDLTATGWNLLATVDGQVVGHIAAVPAEASEPEIVVFVHDAYHNRGIGSELVARIVDYATEEDCEALTLLVTKGNHAAITVYRNAGFEVTNRTVGELEMRLDIGSAGPRAVDRPPADPDRPDR